MIADVIWAVAEILSVLPYEWFMGKGHQRPLKDAEPEPGNAEERLRHFDESLAVLQTRSSKVPPPPGLWDRDIDGRV